MRTKFEFVRSGSTLIRDVLRGQLVCLKAKDSLRSASNCHFSNTRKISANSFICSPVSLTHWVGKVPWGDANHRQIMKTFDLTLNRLLTD